VSRKIELVITTGRLWLRITTGKEEPKLFGPAYLFDARRMVSFAHSLAQEGDELLIDDIIIERSLVWSDF